MLEVVDAVISYTLVFTNQGTQLVAVAVSEPTGLSKAQLLLIETNLGM